MPANQYSDSLLMDALRGSLSNLESLGRGAAVAPIGLLGDINALAREYVTPRLPQSVQGLLQASPAAPTTEQILSNIPRVSQPRMETSGMEQLGAAMNPRGPVDLARGAGRLAGSAVNESMVYGRGPLASITPQPMRIIDLNKGIYKPELTMEEMLKVKDIPTVDRVRQSIDLVGEDQFKKMVEDQFKKYKPTNPETEAMLVESVTLNVLGKAQRSPYPQEEALKLAQQRAALPVEKGGLGLPANNTAADREAAMFPLKLYRGVTGDVESSVIPSDFFGSNYFGKGINLTTSPKDASKYASTDVEINHDLVGKSELMAQKLGISYPEAKAQLTSGGGAVMPLSVNIDNPLIVGAQKIQAPDSVIRYALNESGYSGDVDKLVNQFKNANTGFEQFELIKSKQATPFYQNLSSLMNKNGLMIDESLSPKSQGAMHYVASSPEQLRSRFAAFDPFRKTAAIASAMGVAAPDLLAQEQPVITQKQIDDEMMKYGLLGR